MTGFKYVLSLERLVKMTDGLQTQELYPELKNRAFNKDSDWRLLVQGMTEDVMWSRVVWCEVFISDMLLLDGYILRFEARMMTLGVNSTASPLSDQHHVDKLFKLLTEGEEAMQNEDMAEVVLHRGVNRLKRLVRWGHGVSQQAFLSSCDTCFFNRFDYRFFWPAAGMRAPAEGAAYSARGSHATRVCCSAKPYTSHWRSTSPSSH